MIKQPRWKKVEYSRNQIIKAGKTIKKDCTPEEREFALKVIDNWRASHAFPLQIIYMHLKRMALTNQGIVVAQRLKRLDSIVNKSENKINPNNEFNIKITSQNEETTRTSKMNESNMNNLSDFIQKNIKIKENENSLIDIGDSLYSVNSIPKSIKKSVRKDFIIVQVEYLQK